MARRSDPWTIARASLASRRDSRDFLRCRTRVSESQAGQEVLSQQRTITFSFSGEALEEDASGSTNRQGRFLVRQCAASVAGSPEFKELICAQSGNECTGQFCCGSRLHQLQPTVDTPPVAHPLRTELPPCRIKEDEAQHRRVVGVLLLHGLQPLGKARTRQVDYM